MLCITRRYLLFQAGITCAAFLSPIRGWTTEVGRTSSEAFICGTDESVVVEGGIIDYAATAEDAVRVRQSLTDLRITDYGTAFLAARWRKSDGLTPNTGKLTLGCSFLNGSESEKRQVQDAAEGWLRNGLEQHIEFDFGVKAENSQIRISVGVSGNDSAVGRTALQIRADRPTMNLENIVPEIIQHEFGHALGLRHEHRHPDAGFRFKEIVVIDEMKERYHWTEAMTRSNILDRFASERARCVGDQQFNADSIMIYDIPSRWTESGVSFRSSDTITERDLQCLIGLYGV
jgi:hypothetical protein